MYQKSIIIYFRRYVNSPWCVEEFLVAHQRMVTKQKNFLIPVLMEDLDANELAKHPELELYIKTHTYIDARTLQDINNPEQDKDIDTLRKRIRLAHLTQFQSKKGCTLKFFGCVESL